MSRNHRRWEEPATSHWEPTYSRPYGDEHSWRHYAPPSESLQRRSHNYWRDEAVAPISYYPQRSHRGDDHNEQWHNDGRSWRSESAYSRRGRDFGPDHDRESWRDRSLPHKSSTRHRHSMYTPPYVPRPTFRARSPMESIPPPPKLAPPGPSRKTSSPPVNPSQPLKSSPGYLSVSQEPSEVLHDPGSTRKLLVLDLNGTLLIRSPRSRASSGPQLRPVQPRPYMQSFKQYLFCPQTKLWLDTMVWSSAQPHSVDDMVDKVFGATKNELKMVWNRQSLGLSEADYHRKTVTTKDLTKAWNLLTSAPSPKKLEGCSAVPSQSQVTHSALTTLLLDDSPHKAVLQPYNHVCIPEYSSTRRQHDLRSFLATKEPRDGKRNKKAKQKDRVGSTPLSTDHMVPELPSGSALSEMAEKEPYDVTLLAVIGILEVVKLQSNVAGWIRKGGLWATQERWDKAASGTVVGTGNDASSTSDPAVTPEQVHLQTKMWFDDSLVMAYWATRGRRALMELGIQAVHGVTG